MWTWQSQLPSGNFSSFSVMVTSLAGEIGGPALRRGFDAFAEIVGHAQAILLGEFVIRRMLDAVRESRAHGGAGRQKAERRAFGNFLRERHRGRANLVLRDQDARQSHRQCLLTSDAPAGVEHQLGVRLADGVRQRDGQSEAGMEAQARKVRGKPGLGTRHAEIRRHRQTKAAADCRALHRCDDRLLVPEDAHGLYIEVTTVSLVAAGRRVPGRRIEIRAGAKRLALRGKDDGADLAVRIDLVECVGDVPNELEIEIIQRWPLDLDRCDVALRGNRDISAHVESDSFCLDQRSPSPRAMMPRRTSVVPPWIVSFGAILSSKSSLLRKASSSSSSRSSSEASSRTRCGKPCSQTVPRSLTIAASTTG